MKKRRGGKKCKRSITDLMRGVMLEKPDSLVDSMLKNNALFKDRIGF